MRSSNNNRAMMTDDTKGSIVMINPTVREEQQLKGAVAMNDV
jgi:hypothetical protein